MPNIRQVGRTTLPYLVALLSLAVLILFRAVEGSYISGGGGGGGGAAGSTLFTYVDSTGTGPNNSAAETSLIGTATTGSKTIPANTMVAGQLVEVVMTGQITTPVAASNLTLNMYMGATKVATGSVTGSNINSLTTDSFTVKASAFVSTGGATCSLVVEDISFIVGGLVAGDLTSFQGTGSTYDCTASEAFDFKAQWAAAQVGQSIFGQGVALYIPGAPVTSVNGATGAVVTETSGPFASLPGTCGAGSSYQSTDSPYRFLCGPANTFVPYYEGLKVTVPVSASFTTFNATGTGITFTQNNTGGWINIREQGSSTTGQITGITKATFAATFTAKFVLKFALNAAGTAAEAGICVTDGTKFITMMFLVFPSNQPASVLFNVSKWNSATSFAADYSSQITMPIFTGPLYFVVQETAGARNWFISSDGGRTLSLVLTTGNTDFLTTTRYGVFLRGDSASADSNLTLFSLTESNP